MKFVTIWLFRRRHNKLRPTLMFHPSLPNLLVKPGKCKKTCQTKNCVCIANSILCCAYCKSILIFSSNSSARYIAKLRGLPWSITVEDIVTFFDDCNIKNGSLGVHLTMTKEGRPSGIAYIEMETMEDLELAYKKDRQFLGNRFIEVFRATPGEMRKTLRRSEQSLQRAITDACVRIRGLPYRTSEQDVLNFFEGLDIAPNGISLVYDENGRTTGEAYVQFRDQEVAERALQRDKGRLYHRYIEVFRSSLGELKLAQHRQNYDNQPRELPCQTMDHGSPAMSNYRGYQILKPLRFSGYPDQNIAREWNTMKNSQYDQNNPRQSEAGKAPIQQNQRTKDNKLYSIHMRGLPFDATQEDILQFFSPVVPVGIDIYFTSRGKTTGQADVSFKTHKDLLEAMTKNESYMKHRYIELFE